MMNIFAKVKREVDYAIERRRWLYHMAQMQKHERDKDVTEWKRHAKLSLASMNKALNILEDKEKERNRVV